MIDKEIFAEEWKALLVRFGRKVDEANKDQGKRFYVFLSPQMDTAAFVAASRAVWATSRFFPRPADFLTCGSGAVWSSLVGLLREYRPPAWGGAYTAIEWWDAWRSLPAAATDAAESLGHVEQLQRLAETQSMKFREQWERLYEQRTVSDAVAALPPPKASAAMLGSGG